MNDFPRQKLRELMAQHGIDALLDSSRRCRAYLLDCCGAYRREVFALVTAHEEQIPHKLLASNHIPPVMLLANLTERLASRRPLDKATARWAVEAWAWALNAQSLILRGQPIAVPLAPGVELHLLYIPAGEFEMGSERQPGAQVNEYPRHHVALDVTWIAQTPVTRAHYEAFVRATGHPAPMHWTLLPGEMDFPVVGVTWHDAAAFCTWLGQQPGLNDLSLTARLSTEAEWERAARGDDGRLYPWGNEPPDATKCNFDNTVKSPSPAGHYSPAGDSPYGCADMAGNVWEWVSDGYGPYPAARVENPVGLATATFRVLRGGAWNTPARCVRASQRNRLHPDFGSLRVGFRCVAVVG